MRVYVNGTEHSTSYTQGEIESISVRLSAWDGELGNGSAPIPDPAGDQEPYAGQSFKVTQDGITVVDGFVGPLDRERGEGAAAPRRVNTYAVGDDNALLYGFRVVNWSRPAESTRARFLAFLAETPALAALDTTWVLNTDVATMPARRYTTEDLFRDLIQEISDLTGCTAFVERRRAHLHLPTDGITAGLAFTDGTPDFVTTFPIYSPRRSKDPLELGNDVLVKTPSGTSSASDATSITRHDAGGLKHQRVVELDAGDAATRSAKAAKILASSKDERITYEFESGPFTAAQLEQIPVGSLITITSQVLGLSASVERIASMTIRYRHPGAFFVTFELGYPIRTGIRSRPTPPPAPFVPDFETTSTVFAALDAAGDDAEGYPPVIGFTNTGDSPPSGWDIEPLVGPLEYVYEPASSRYVGIRVLGRGKVSLYFKCSLNGVYGAPPTATWSIVRNGVPVAIETQTDSGGPALHGFSTSKVVTAVDVAVEAGDVIAGWLEMSDGSTPTVPWGTGTGDEALRITGGTLETGAILNAPAVGQEVVEEFTSDGSTTAFTTNWPYQENSLRVSAGGIAIVADETDPATGQFEIPTALPAGTKIVARYTAADGEATGEINPVPTSAVTTAPPALIGSGTADATTYLRGDGSWQPLTAVAVAIEDAGGNFTGDTVEEALAELAAATHTLDDLSDVVTGGAADGDVLTFDSVTGTWGPEAPPSGTPGGGGGAATVPTWVQRKTSVQNTQNPAVTLDSAPTEGNVLLLCVGANSRGITSITQTGVTWSLLTSFSGNSQYAEIWKGVVGASASASIAIATSVSTWIQVGIVELPYSDLTYQTRATETGTGGPPTQYVSGPLASTAGRLAVFVASEGNGLTQMRPEMSTAHAPILFLSGTGVFTIGYTTGGHMYGWTATATSTAHVTLFAELSYS